MISIIVPTLNEEGHIKVLLKQLSEFEFEKEVLVIDGGSTDNTLDVSKQYSDKVYQVKNGRANQMSYGASRARGKFLLFLHADVHFKEDPSISLKKLLDRQTSLASFRIQFDQKHWFLRFNAFFSRFTVSSFYFGDQGLWISEELYDQSGGYNTNDIILEDQKLYKRANKIKTAIKVPLTLIVSSRRYKTYGIFRLQFFYYRLWLMYKFGFNQKVLEKKYAEFMA